MSDRLEFALTILTELNQRRNDSPLTVWVLAMKGGRLSKIKLKFSPNITCLGAISYLVERLSNAKVLKYAIMDAEGPIAVMY